MRRVSVIFMVLSLFLLGACLDASASDYVDQANIKINMVNQDPDPVQPGHYVDVRFSIENIGTSPASDAEVEILPDYPFSLDPGQDAKKAFPTMNPLQKNDNAAIVKYKLRVNDNAVEGENSLKLRYRYDGGEWNTQDFDISIRTVDAQLSIESITTTPERIVPGENAIVQMRLRNLDDSLLKDINVKLDLTLATVSAAADLDVLPFAPIKSATEKKIQLIGPGEEVVLNYDIIAYPGADAKVYKVPVQIRYYDVLGTEYTKSDYVGLVVGSEPELSIVLDSTTVNSRPGSGEVSIKFVNKGVTNVKFLNVRLRESDYYSATSSEEVYVGNINSDDYETAEFQINVLENTPDELSIPIEIEYRDSNNVLYSKDASVMLKFNHDAASAEGKDSKTVVYVLAGVVLLIAAAIVWRFRKKRKA